MNELNAFIKMLERAQIGHGTRHDYNPIGTGVQVESGDSLSGVMVTEFAFDEAGTLVEVLSYPCE